MSSGPGDPDDVTNEDVEEGDVGLVGDLVSLFGDDDDDGYTSDDDG